MEALHDVVRAGKARYIGASSMHAWQFAKAQHVAERNGWTRFVSMQNHYNLLYREEEREMIPQCIDQGVGVIPWSPLARGFLTGTRTREGERRTTRAETDALPGRPLRPPGGLRRHRPPQRGGGRALRLRRRRSRSPGCCTSPASAAPIVGATKLEHLEEAIAAANLSLSAEEIERLEEPYVPHPVLGPRVAAMEGQAPSPPETWDALFSDFYLRAFANEEADADAGANAQSAARLAACPARRGPARRALRVRAPRHPAGARRLPRDGSRPLADAARRGPAAGGRRAPRSSSRPTTASCPSRTGASTPR